MGPLIFGCHWIKFTCICLSIPINREVFMDKFIHLYLPTDLCNESQSMAAWFSSHLPSPTATSLFLQVDCMPESIHGYFSFPRPTYENLMVFDSLLLAFKSLIIAGIIMPDILLSLLDLKTNFSMIICLIWSSISTIWKFLVFNTQLLKDSEMLLLM